MGNMDFISCSDWRNRTGMCAPHFCPRQIIDFTKCNLSVLRKVVYHDTDSMFVEATKEEQKKIESEYQKRGLRND